MYLSNVIKYILRHNHHFSLHITKLENIEASQFYNTIMAI
jgi:hypothetical protein